MKKLMIAGLLCVVMLAGCGNGASNETTDYDKVDTVSDKNLYESEDLITETVGDLEYKIPESWSSDTKTSGDNLYYYGDEVTLMIQNSGFDYNTFDDAFDVLPQEDAMNEILDGFKQGTDSYEEILTESQQILGVTGFRMEANVEMSGNKYYMDNLCFAYNQQSYSFGILVEDDSEKKYSEEFNDLISSITVWNPLADIGFEYEFDSENYIMSDIVDSGEIRNNLIFDESMRDIGRICYSLITVTLAEQSDFSVSYKEGDDFCLYCKLNGTLISDDIPELPDEIDETWQDKIMEFYEEFLDFLDKSNVINESSETDIGEIEGEIGLEDAREDSNITMGQLNALDSAKSYLSFTAFSYEGLIDQLEFEGYTTEDATYAAENCGANWNEQALKKAKSYLDSTAFSYTGLIDQLEYEGFTSEQATYGVDQCGADWNEQAVKKAESYLSWSSFSKEELIGQLEYEGFTHEQAVYGVEQNGY